MEEGAKRHCHRAAGPALAVGARCLLFAAGLLGLTLLPAPRACAQHLAISEVVWSPHGTTRSRAYWEVANLDTVAWNPNNYWLLRIGAGGDATNTTQQGFIRITGVDSIPPGGVLDVEWGRPTTDLPSNVTGTTKGNVFITGRTFADGTALDADDLHQDMALAVYAPTANNAAPTVANGTMVAYYFQGDPAADDHTKFAYDKAVQNELWTDGESAGNPKDPNHPSVLDWATALRMGPDAYSQIHGQSANDYYHTLAGLPSLDDAGMNVTTPPAPAPNTMNRAGTPGQPNYLWGVPPLPGQIAAGFSAASVQAISTSLVANAPPPSIHGLLRRGLRPDAIPSPRPRTIPTGLAIVAISKDGFLGTSVFSNNQWSPLSPIFGIPVDSAALIDNPERGSRSLVIRTQGTGAGALFQASQPANSNPKFWTFRSLGFFARYAPVVAVDPATGNEYYVAVDPGTGSVAFAQDVNGTLSAWQTIPGLVSGAPVAAVWSPDGGSLVVVAWKAGTTQLVLNRTDASGKFGAWQNVGVPAVSRATGVGPVVAYNPVGHQLEIVTTTGTLGIPMVQHVHVQLSRTAVSVGALLTAAAVSTNTPPAIAVNSDTGQIRLLVRAGIQEPGLDPRGASFSDADQHGLKHAPPDSPQTGFVLSSTFNGAGWSTPARVGTGRLPGPSPATPLFKAPVAPVTLYDPNTKKFQDLLVGEDGQVYQVVVP